MFFIGGFNSIIPYVIYLSLIWTVVILGFGGRIAAMLHKHPDNELTSTAVISQSGDDQYFNCYNYSSTDLLQDETSADIPDLTRLPDFPLLSRHIRIRNASPHLPSSVPFSFLFRGPPLLN
jgi:hypothetical protein